MKRYRIIFLSICFLSVLFLSCEDRKVPEVKEDSPQYYELIDIYKGFEGIVINYKDSPETGVKKCREYVEKNIKKVKLLQKQFIQNSNNSSIGSGAKLNKIIKKISDRIIEVVVESYGVYGTDILISYSDISLARI